MPDYHGISPSLFARSPLITRKGYVWSQHKGIITTTTENRLTGARTHKWDEAPMATTPKGSAYSTPGGSEMFGEPRFAEETLGSALAHAVIIEAAVREMASHATIITDKLTGARVVALPDLELAARRAFWTVMARKSTHLRVDKALAELSASAEECLVPTPNGLQQGRTNVICGEFEYDQRARVLLRRGKPVLSDDTVNGLSLVFGELAK